MVNSPPVWSSRPFSHDLKPNGHHSISFDTTYNANITDAVDATEIFLSHIQPSSPVFSFSERPSIGLHVERLSATYRSVRALQDVSFALPSGQLIGIFGPNGAGKSTLIKAMLGLIPGVSGQAMVSGRSLCEQLDRVAYVPQRSHIDWTFPVSVWDVVLMGRVKKAGLFSRLSVVSRHIAATALKRVGMWAYRDRRIGELSGGQQQRVFLARSLAQEADLFFLDEPFVGVDQTTEDLLFDVFRELATEGKMVVVVNHDLGESITHFDQLILLNGQLIAAGPREHVFTADNMTRAYGDHVRFFMEDMV